MGLEHMSCKIVLHSALPSELSWSGSWTNLNSVLYHLLNEWQQRPYCIWVPYIIWNVMIWRIWNVRWLSYNVIHFFNFMWHLKDHIWTGGHFPIKAKWECFSLSKDILYVRFVVCKTWGNSQNVNFWWRDFKFSLTWKLFLLFLTSVLSCYVLCNILFLG